MRILALAATSAACIAMTACAPLRALSGFNSALVPELKPMDVKIHTDISCGDMAAQAVAMMAGSPVNAAIALAMVQACEHRDASTTLSVDPQGARKALQQMIAKPAVPLATGTVLQ